MLMENGTFLIQQNDGYPLSLSHKAQMMSLYPIRNTRVEIRKLINYFITQIF